MGNYSSRLTQEELQELTHLTYFSEQEIKKLYKRFKHLDKENKAHVSLTELMAIPELSANPLAHRILDVFDTDKCGQLNFKQFLECLDIFSKEQKRDVKVKFAFQVYDVNRDGFLDSQDLFQIVKLLVGSNLMDSQIQQIVDQTLLDVDTLDVDGRISLDEFKRAMFAVDFENILSISFWLSFSKIYCPFHFDCLFHEFTSTQNCIEWIVNAFSMDSIWYKCIVFDVYAFTSNRIHKQVHNVKKRSGKFLEKKRKIKKWHKN